MKSSMDMKSHEFSQPTWQIFVQGDSVQSQKALKEHVEVTEKIRAAASFASGKAAEKSIRLSLKRRPPTVYHVGDDVLVRPSKRWKALNKSTSVPIIAEGKVVATDDENSRYHIALCTGETEWYAVTNINSLTVEEEKKRPKERPKAQGINDN